MKITNRPAPLKLFSISQLLLESGEQFDRENNILERTKEKKQITHKSLEERSIY